MPPAETSKLSSLRVPSLPMIESLLSMYSSLLSLHAFLLHLEYVGRSCLCSRNGLVRYLVAVCIVCGSQRSSIFVPISGIGNSGSGIGNSGSEEISISQRKERQPPTMKTINEDDSRRVS